MYKGLIQKHFTTLVTVTFDTLKFVETLKEAGVPEAQAKASLQLCGSHKTPQNLR